MSPYVRPLLSIILGLASAIPTHAQSTAFTYQGSLTDASGVVNGEIDFEFRLFDAVNGGRQVGLTVALDDVVVTNGLFTVTLDFTVRGFDGSPRWLDIAVRPGASTGLFAGLSPRQPVTSAPHAIQAANATTVSQGTISDPDFLGTTTTAPLQLQVDGEVGWQLQYATGGGVPNIIGGFAGNSVTAGSEGVVVAGGGAEGFENSVGFNSSYSAIGGGSTNVIGANTWNATIAGGRFNEIGVNADFGTIAGGLANWMADDSESGSIGGGEVNRIYPNTRAGTIGGGRQNSLFENTDTSSIGGGLGNSIHPNGAQNTISGGINNSIGEDSWRNAIGGGANNQVGTNTWHSAIPGGYWNRVGPGVGYSLAAGRQAKADHNGTFVWADSEDADFISTGDDQFLIRAAGGVAINTNDTAGAALRVAGSIKADSYLGMGGALTLGTTDNEPLQFRVNDTAALRLEPPAVGSTPNIVGGDSGNVIGNGAQGSVIAGGGGAFLNTIGANSDFSVLAGGFNNDIGIDSSFATVSGGAGNLVRGGSNNGSIGGGSSNEIGSNSTAATIAGGTANDVGDNSSHSFIGGGYNNNVLDGAFSASIVGGRDNEVGSSHGHVGGGQGNSIAPDSSWSSLTGGATNSIGANSRLGFIGGGYENSISPNAPYSMIIGGGENNVGPNASTALAAGYRAHALHQGAFVWSDTQRDPFPSTANNQFNVRAMGGARFETSGAGMTIDGVEVFTGDDASQLTSGILNDARLSSNIPRENTANTFTAVQAISSAGGTPQLELRQTTAGNFARLRYEVGGQNLWDVAAGGSNDDFNFYYFPAGANRMTLKANGDLELDGVVKSSSDRNVKQDFEVVDPSAVLTSVLTLPIQTWAYTNSPTERHIGPVAQDFHATFGLSGADDRHIATVDADGVALAAIQGLNRKFEDRLDEKEREIAELERTVAKLEQAIEALLQSSDPLK